MKRGTVVGVDLSDATPSETGKVRPAIVVTGTAYHDVLGAVVVRPTSSIAPEICLLRVAVGSLAGKDSYAVIPGIRQVRKGRLRGALGQLSGERLALLDDGLDAHLR